MRTVLVASVLAALSGSWAARVEDPGAGASAPPSNPSQPQSQSQGQPQPQSPAQSEEERRKLEEEIAKELGATPPPAQPAAPATPPGAAPDQNVPAPTGQGTQGGSPYARLLLMPDLSAIGSFGAALDGYDVERRSPRPEAFGPKDQPRFFFQELEVGLQAVVDPYVRADAFLSFTPEGVDVEEAYATTLTRPAGLQVRAGKFFSPFGRQNQQHPHVLDFVDFPLARTRLLAQDSLSGPGVDVAWLAPLPWYAELHVTGQETSPFGEKEGGLTGLARLLQYFPLGDATTLGVGVSGARRGEGTPGAFRDVAGADAYLRIRPLRTRA